MLYILTVVYIFRLVDFCEHSVFLISYVRLYTSLIFESAQGVPHSFYIKKKNVTDNTS